MALAGQRLITRFHPMGALASLGCFFACGPRVLGPPGSDQPAAAPGAGSSTMRVPFIVTT